MTAMTARPVLIVTTFLFVVACTEVSVRGESASTDPGAESTTIVTDDGPRSVLTFEQLISGPAPDSPVDEVALAAAPGAGDAGAAFEGRLELVDSGLSGQIEVIRGDSDVDPDLARLPSFDFAFVQDDGYLIPEQRGLIITDHPTWNYYLEPGRVWTEEADMGHTRASFPFALVPKDGNSTYNGTMTFLFDETSISNVWYQITQETSFFFRANFWGLLEANYHPESVASAGEIRAAHRAEIENRFPTKPISQLAIDYPDVDPSRFGAGLTLDHRTTFGVVVDGVNYRSECHTRFGPYTYCEYMRSASWSTAKSAFAGIVMMRLAQQYDEGVPDLLIRDYLPEHAGSPGDWSEVTFNNTLDMATGNYESARFMVDENQFETHPYWAETEYAPKIAAALSWPDGGDPGETWVYHTSDTFIVTRAMHNYLRDVTDSDSDIFQYVVDEVYNKIDLSSGARSTLRTSDNNWTGQAYGGHGMWWVPDDIAKIATLLQDGGVDPSGTQLLHPGLVAASLQRDPGDRGVEISDRNRYNNAFWATRYGPGQGFDCEFWVTEMRGISGVVVVLMPNGVTYYYISDNQEFTWDVAVTESDKIAPNCD